MTNAALVDSDRIQAQEQSAEISYPVSMIILQPQVRLLGTLSGSVQFLDKILCSHQELLVNS
jgi:hypothetical protein